MSYIGRNTHGMISHLKTKHQITEASYKEKKKDEEEAAANNPLLFFRDNEKDFPVLWEMAKIIFCLVPSSSPFESILCITGNTQTKLRTNLLPTLIRKFHISKTKQINIRNFLFYALQSKKKSLWQILKHNFWVPIFTKIFYR